MSVVLLQNKASHFGQDGIPIHFNVGYAHGSFAVLRGCLFAMSFLPDEIVYFEHVDDCSDLPLLPDENEDGRQDESPEDCSEVRSLHV